MTSKPVASRISNSTRDLPAEESDHSDVVTPRMDESRQTHPKSGSSGIFPTKTCAAKNIAAITDHKRAPSENARSLVPRRDRANRENSKLRQRLHHNEIQALTTRPNMPSKNLGLETWGPWGPFNALTILNLALEERAMIHYAFNHSWRAFGESEAGRDAFSQRWMWRMMESPAALHAQILGACTHRMGSSSRSAAQNSILATGLRSKGKAIKALQHEIEQFQGSSDAAVSDSMLLSIFVLAIHERIDLSYLPEPHPRSPMATYRDMHIYGRMKFKKEHMDALYALIDRKGGLPNMDEPTFGYVIPPADMVFNNFNGAAPKLPNYRQFKPILRTEQWQPDKTADDLLENLGGVFQKNHQPLSISPFIQLSENMLMALSVVTELTVALDHFTRGENGAPVSLDLLVNNCDWVAHQLLSEPSYLQTAENDVPPSQDPTALSEICRLSSLIYLDMVILPTPPHSGIKNRLAATMLPLIQLCQKEPWEEKEGIAEFLAWATILGGIGARFTNLESAYIDLLASSPIRRSHNWDAIHRQLKHYLWLDSVCDEPARYFWSEAGGLLSVSS